MSPALFGPLAFAITFAETWVSHRERVNERKARTWPTMRYSIFSANWSTAFEAILLADILMSVAEPKLIAPWVLAGAWIGQLLANEKTRRKFRRNAGNVANLRKKAGRGTISVSTPEGGTSATPAVAVFAPTDQT